MRIGSQRVPFRVVIASVSLVGLGVAAALPIINSHLPTQSVDPILTGSTDRAASDEPLITELPAATEVSPQVVPRQILPQASDTVLGAPLDPSKDDTPLADLAATSEPDPAVAPMMTDDDGGDMPEMGLTTSLAGEASDPSGILLALDHARVLRVVGDIATIIIGNPAIADASMPDSGTIILTGKSYGETNIVMLDQEGEIVAEQTLRVTVRGQSLVSVYRGVQRTTLSCAPTCEIRPTPGDNSDAMTAGLQQFDARNQAALQAVAAE